MGKHGEGNVSAHGYRRFGNGGNTYEHIMIAEKALGKKLSKGAQVHHVDEDSLNNEPSNLVVCPDAAYHKLLHRRQKALDACGNANFVKCRYCLTWDDPKNMKQVSTRPSSFYHSQCANEAYKRYCQRKGNKR